MSNPMSYNQRSKSLGRVAMEFFLSKFVNQHTKRIIYITSLYSRISHLEKLEKSAMTKLNHWMVLARDENALALPSRLGNTIWNGTTVCEKLRPEVIQAQMTEQERLRLSEEVVDLSPQCLRYRTRPEMVKDVYSLLQQFNHLNNNSVLPAAA